VVRIVELGAHKEVLALDHTLLDALGDGVTDLVLGETGVGMGRV
jgi:hypothetical protein